MVHLFSRLHSVPFAHVPQDSPVSGSLPHSIPRQGVYARGQTAPQRAPSKPHSAAATAGSRQSSSMHTFASGSCPKSTPAFDKQRWSDGQSPSVVHPADPESQVPEHWPLHPSKELSPQTLSSQLG